MVILALSSLVKVQSQNLQFSRVLSVSRTTATTDTVPAGKVWKLEFVSCNSPSKSVHNIVVNNNIVSLYTHESSGNSAYHDYIGPAGPIWLSEGTTLRSGSAGLTYFFSIIEFTVVP